jgi:Ku protein
VPLTLPCIRFIRNRLGRNVDAGGRYLSVDEASRRYIVPEYPPRAYWKGYLKLSLVSCPIALYPATSEREKISFNQLNKETGNRIRYRKVDAETGDEVEQGNIIKGYEVAKGEYIELQSEELEAVALESKRTIEIDEFVPKSQIDVHARSVLHRA